jgi:hypothetical protein
MEFRSLVETLFAKNVEGSARYREIASFFQNNAISNESHETTYDGPVPRNSQKKHISNV